jgi:hypothetical protein
MTLFEFLFFIKKVYILWVHEELYWYMRRTIEWHRHIIRWCCHRIRMVHWFIVELCVLVEGMLKKTLSFYQYFVKTAHLIQLVILKISVNIKLRKTVQINNFFIISLLFFKVKPAFLLKPPSPQHPLLNKF